MSGPETTTAGIGWLCPRCHGAHPPSVTVCHGEVLPYRDPYKDPYKDFMDNHPRYPWPNDWEITKVRD